MTMLLLLAHTALAGGARPVTPTYEGNCQNPIWSPDGSKLAYEVNYHERKTVELFVYEPGKDPRQVVPISRGTSSMTAGFAGAESESVAHEPAWGPAFMGRFVYSASTTKKDYDLFIDGASAIAPGPGTDGGPSWSADGKWIVYTSARTGEGDLYLIDVHNIENEPTRLTRYPETSELYAQFAPDSAQVVFVAHTKAGDNLWLIKDLADPKPERITDWSRTQTRPTWSPDGNAIAFYANKDDPDRFDLWVTTTTGMSRKVADGVVMSASGPAWTPDSSSIVFVQDDDDNYDPIWKAPIKSPEKKVRIDSGTVGNTDVSVVTGTDGNTWLAVAAQGLIDDKVRDFKRIYVMEVK